AAAALDRAGYFSLEVWGGATFDVCLRFLNECPWERLRALRKALPNTRLQMLLRGQNRFGYRHYADDVVDAFVEKARENGIDVFRIFDALNDIRNLVRAMHAVRRFGGMVEGTISYTVSPVHTIAQFVAFSRQLKDEGAELICIKDMAGMISPAAAFELISALKQEVGLPVHLHTHCASGLAPATFLAAARAGLDIVDCALSPFSWGTSQPPTESIAAMFSEGEFECGIDLDAVYEAAEHFQKVRERYMPILDTRSERVDTRILQHQIPGGMLSNLLSQLTAQGARDKLPRVLEETAAVRRDLGYPPLVTPTSQIVGTQAVFNVIAGERYKMVSEEVKEYCRGRYGRSPAPVDPEVRRKAIGDEVPIECRPADRLEPELQKAVEATASLSGAQEDALSYALFPQVAVAFLKARKGGTKPATTELPPEQLKPRATQVEAVQEGGRTFHVTVDRKPHEVQVQQAAGDGGGRRLTLLLDGKERMEVVVQPKGGAKRKSRGQAGGGAGAGTITAPMPGMIVKVMVKEGDAVEKGSLLLVLEAMKMQNEIKSPVTGKVRKVAVAAGDSIETRGIMLEIEPVKAE
ncbi:MAG: pyruvate carboxylase subunit B, partial [Deltaproteobacteria bacterium]|nr:pyruvate carboxylase subunit B [Deltaproteobacteria bacterium]